MATTYTRKDRKGRKYRLLDYTPPGGKRVRKSLGPVTAISQTEARLAAGARDYEIRTGKPVFTPAPLFEVFRTEYLAWRAGKFPRSQERVEQILTADHMEVFVGHALSDPAMTKLIDTWQVQRLRQVSNNSMVKEYRQVHALFAKAIAWKLGIVDNPAKREHADRPKEKRRKVRIAYSSAEAARLYACPLHGDKWRLMCNTGLRRMEALMMETSWFDIPKRTLTIHAQDEGSDTEEAAPAVKRVKGRGRTATLDTGWEPKSGHLREVPLNNAAIEAFRNLMRGRELQHYVFPRIQKRGLSKAFERDRDRCGLRGSLHSTRHTYGMHLAEAGVPLPTIQALMGHADIKTTMIYAITSKDHARKLALRVAV